MSWCGQKSFRGAGCKEKLKKYFVRVYLRLPQCTLKGRKRDIESSLAVTFVLNRAFPQSPSLPFKGPIRIKASGKDKGFCKKQSFNARTGRFYERKRRFKKKQSRPKGYIPQRAGDLIQMDTFHLFVDGVKRYVISAMSKQEHEINHSGGGSERSERQEGGEPSMRSRSE
ncbi:MAG: hypothetical protein ACUVQ3_10165 [bacterium]